MLDAFASLLCSKLCQHNWRKPNQNMQKEKPENKKDSVKDAAVKKKEKKVTEDIQIIGIYMRCTVNPYKRRLMTDLDFEIILSSNWLIDTIINTAQNCLNTQFELPGLYDTSLGLHLSYPKAEVFHQILITGSLCPLLVLLTQLSSCSIVTIMIKYIIKCSETNSVNSSYIS